MAVERPILNIVGERVALGPLCEEHIDAIVRWQNDYSTYRYFDAPGPQRPDAARQRLTEGMFASAETVFYVVYEVATWRMIGTAGLINVEQINRTAELFIMLGDPDVRGKGYGTEATRLVLDHAFISLGLASVRLGVFSYNPGAVRAYEKAGFKHAGVLRRNKMMGGQLWDTILMDILADEFESPVLSRVLLADERR